MHPAPSFGRGHALQAMAATFSFDGLHAWPSQRQDQARIAGALVRLSARAGLSSVTRGEPKIGTGEFSHEDARISTPLACPDFDETRCLAAATAIERKGHESPLECLLNAVATQRATSVRRLVHGERGQSGPMGPKMLMRLHKPR